MNRIEFMEELSGLLQDIPEEDRMDALNYYNDYFDDAGAENEKNVIDELESPEKVAAKIKADREDPEDGKAGMPMEQDNKPWTNKWLKMILIVAIILVGCPVIVPVAIGLLAAIAGILIAAFAFFIAIVIGFAAIVLRGNRSDSSRYWKYVCEYRSRSCTIRSRYDTDCCWCDRNRGRDKTLYHCISRDDQRNCMDSQKTISQEGDGVRYEKKMENILDRMWYMFPGWDHMLWCSVGNWNNTG